MTRFDDELDYVCAWGRWRIGQALNEPVLSWTGERRCLDHRVRQRLAQKTVRKTSATRGSARLRLVSDAGRLVGRGPGSVR
jgi:hypothetical protein